MRFLQNIVKMTTALKCNPTIPTFDLSDLFVQMRMQINMYNDSVDFRPETAEPQTWYQSVGKGILAET